MPLHRQRRHSNALSTFRRCTLTNLQFETQPNLFPEKIISVLPVQTLHLASCPITPSDIGRRTPAKGVHIYSGQPNWVFLTVCTEKRKPWLAQPDIHKSLHEIWEHTAKAWLVSDYTLLPDHLHLFCAPHDLRFTIERWIGFWKRRLADKHPGVANSRQVVTIIDFDRTKAMSKNGNTSATTPFDMAW